MRSTTPRRRARVPIVPSAAVLAAIVGGGLTSTGLAQGRSTEPTSGRLTIPYLANATRPDDLDFTAAECDLAPGGTAMTCRFRQVLLTTSSVDATSCVITTNGYERAFRRGTSALWVSRSAPVGECGVVETTSLADGGGTRWTMTIRSAATLRADQPACRAVSEQVEIHEWRGVKRNLPCTSIQPGAIER